MKKRISLFSKIFVATAALFTISGCDSPSGIESAVLDPNYKSVWNVGEVNFDAFKFIVTYTNGIVEEKPVTTDNIEKGDLYKFYQVGDWKVKFNYQGYYTNASFKIVKNSFSDEIKLENASVLYDGQPHGLNLVGPVPEGTTVYYPFGNSFVESSAVAWDVKCILTKEGYETKELNGKLYISASHYNQELLDQIKFESKEVPFDGAEKRIFAENVPSDITVSYTIDGKPGNSARNAGVYNVIAKFSCSNKNYLPIPDKHAVLKINQIPYNFSKIKFSDKVVTFDGNPHALEVEGLDTIPDVRVVYDNNENLVDAGDYKVTAHFICDPNFEQIPDMEATLTILPADVQANIKFNPQVEDYDGQPKDFKFTHELPGTISVEPVYYTYPDGELVKSIVNGEESNLPVDAGEYKVKFRFFGNHIENYNIVGVPEKGGTLIINPKKVDFSNVKIPTIYEIPNDGQKHDFEGITGLPEEFGVSFTYSKGNEVFEGQISKTGVYSVEVDYVPVSGDKISNYKIVNGPSTHTEMIIYEERTFSGVEYTDVSHPYTGSPIEYDGVTGFDGQDLFKLKFEYFLNGALVATPTDPGTYSVRVSLETIDEKADIRAYKISGLPTNYPNLVIEKKVG